MKAEMGCSQTQREALAAYWTDRRLHVHVRNEVYYRP